LCYNESPDLNSLPNETCNHVPVILLFQTTLTIW